MTKYDLDLSNLSHKAQKNYKYYKKNLRENIPKKQKKHPLKINGCSL